MITFTLTDEQEKKYEKWMDEIRLKSIEEQKLRIKETHEFYHFYKACWDMGFPYTGAIGGGTTFQFTSTSLGDVIRVKDYLTGEELDLTDYKLW